MSVKIVTLSKKTFTQQFLDFSFCMCGLAGICHTPRFCHCVLTKILSCPRFFFVIAPFLSCVVLCCFPLHALSFVFYLVWCSGCKVYPLLCHRGPCVLAAVLSECGCCAWVSVPSQKGPMPWAGMENSLFHSSFLNASRRILDRWLFLCPLLWSSLLHPCNLVG